MGVSSPRTQSDRRPAERALLCAAFVLLAVPVLTNRATEPSGMAPEKRLFGFSVIYLFALFGALVADRWIVW